MKTSVSSLLVNQELEKLVCYYASILMTVLLGYFTICSNICVINYVEASKLVMTYVTKVSTHNEGVERIKEQLLQSNPVLEGMVTHFW